MEISTLFETISVHTLALATLIAFLGGFTRGFSGFGLALITVPLLTLIVAPRLAVPVAIILQLGGIIQLLRPAIPLGDWKAIRWLVVGASIATPVGLVILTLVPEDPMRVAIGGATLIASLVLAFAKNVTISDARTASVGFGMLSGLCNGAAGIPGPPVIVYLLARTHDAATGRASLIIYFSILAVFSGIIAAIAGLVVQETLILAAGMLPGMFAGTAAGAWCFKRFGTTTYRPVVISLLIFVAVAALIKGIIGIVA